MRRLAVVYLLVLGGLRVTLAAPEGCAAPSSVQMRRAAARAAGWITANQRADGSFLYEATASGEDLGGYNNVRHAGVVLSLYQAANRGGFDEARDAADRGVGWLLRFTHDGAVDDGGGRGSLGGSALFAAALVERRAARGDERYDDVLRDLGGFIVGLQRTDGGFHVSRDLRTGEVDRVTTSRYYPGEALWALAQLAVIEPDERWTRAARRAAAFIATRRDDAESVPSPPLNDHWASYGFAEMGGWRRPGVSRAMASYARELYGRFSLLIRSESARDQSWIAGLTHGPPRRSAALGTWVEGQAALALLARRDDRVASLGDRILASARCGAGVLVRRQAADGAWYARGQTRMDDQQHAISGLLHLASLS